jgi:CRISPR-associated Cas5-like protein
MKALAVQVRAPTASFRRPLDHTYQRTLPLPPPTTVIGLAAAALGISASELWKSDSPLGTVRVQTLAQNIPARAADLWTLLKIKSGKMERSPYLRELLFNAQFTCCIKPMNHGSKCWSKRSANPFTPFHLGGKMNSSRSNRANEWSASLPSHLTSSTVRFCLATCAC